MKHKEKYCEFIETFEVERDFFKCHEILEDIWVEETKCETRKHVSINLLLLAVGLHHWRNNNFKGAIQVLENSLKNYDDISIELEKLNINSTELKLLIKNVLEDLRNGNEYKEVYLPRY